MSASGYDEMLLNSGAQQRVDSIATEMTASIESEDLNEDVMPPYLKLRHPPFAFSKRFLRLAGLAFLSGAIIGLMTTVGALRKTQSVSSYLRHSPRLCLLTRDFWPPPRR